MSKVSVETLFDEFATRYLRGEQPDVREYLERAGPDDRDDLGRMLDRFLQAAPARASSEEDVVLMQARLEAAPPLLVLRLRRGLRVDTVTDALLGALGIDPGKRRKVKTYYQRLETGLLDPTGVDTSVWGALGEFLHANARALAGSGFRPPALEVVYHRDADYAAAPAVIPTHAAESEWDEVDEFFLGRTDVPGGST